MLINMDKSYKQNTKGKTIYIMIISHMLYTCIIPSTFLTWEMIIFLGTHAYVTGINKFESSDATYGDSDDGLFICKGGR